MDLTTVTNHPFSLRLRPLLPILLMVLCVTLLYGHTLSAPWYLDDGHAILRNPLVTDFSRALRGILAPRGVAYLSFALNYKIGGFSLPFFHLTNIGIHLACGVIVYLLLKRIFNDELFLPLCGGLLFLAHPLQTQAVTYIVQRMASLSTLFFLLALYLFVRSRECLAEGHAFNSLPHLGSYLGSLFAGLLAIATKENAAVLPVALLLFSRSFLPTERSWRPLLLATAPFLAAPLLMAIPSLFLPMGRGTPLTMITDASALPYMAEGTPLRYLLTEFSVLWIYLRLVFIPYGQAFEHGYPLVESLMAIKTIVAGSGLCLLGWLAWCLRHIHPRITFGIAWFFLTLAVESTILPLDPLYEHRLYLPLFGLLVVFLDLTTRIRQRRLAKGLLLSAILVCAILTWHRNNLWVTPIALFEDNLRQVQPNARTLNNLAQEYILAGRFADAEQVASQAMALDPKYAGNYISLARVYLQQQRTQEALRIIEAGMKLHLLAMSAELHELLAYARIQQSRPDLAIEPLTRALSFNRNSAILNNLGFVYRSLGRWQEAEQSFREAIAQDQDDPLPHANLAQLLRDKGHLPDALAEYRVALRLEPDNAKVRAEAVVVAGRLGTSL